jgi:hypothetical protein
MSISSGVGLTSRLSNCHGEGKLRAIRPSPARDKERAIPLGLNRAWEKSMLSVLRAPYNVR